MNKKEKINAIINANFEEFSFLYNAWKVNAAPSYDSLIMAALRNGPRFRRQVEAIIAKNTNANYNPDDINIDDDFDLDLDPVIGIDGEPIDIGTGGGGFDPAKWIDGLIKIGSSGVDLWKKYKTVNNYDPNPPQPDPQMPPPGYYEQQKSSTGISQQTLYIGGGLLVLVIIVLLFKK